MFVRKNEIISLILNGIVFAVTAVTASIGIVCGAGAGQVGNFVIGAGYFKPFTMDSNILAGISSLIIAFFNIRNLRQKKLTTPRWAEIFHFIGVASVSLTFITVVIFLAPLKVMHGNSYFLLFQDDMFFFHFLNPVICIFSFVCLQKKYLFPKRYCFFGMIPTVIYSVIYVTMVVFLKRWDDFYYFTFGGRNDLVPFVMVIFYAVILALSLLLIILHNRCAKSRNR